MKEAFLLRNALTPYTYTHARKAYDTGVSLVHPMYYDWAADEDAYIYTDSQYMFGDAILAAPISQGSNQNKQVITAVYLPAERWMEWTRSHGTPLVLEGPTVVKRAWELNEIPMYVRVNSVVPLKTTASVTATTADPLVWALFFPIESRETHSGNGVLYEDDGVSQNYTQDNDYSVTSLAFSHTYPDTVVVISPAQGSYSGMPSNRNHVLQLRGRSLTDAAPEQVLCNGNLIPGPVKPGVTPGWYVASNTTYPLLEPEGTLVIALGSFQITTDEVDVAILWPRRK